MRRTERTIRLSIDDIYLGVEQRLESWHYYPNKEDAIEFTASVVDLYLNSADRGIHTAAVDMTAARLCFIWFGESIHTKLATFNHIDTLVNFITSDLYIQLVSLSAFRIRDYTLYGYLLTLKV